MRVVVCVLLVPLLLCFAFCLLRVDCCFVWWCWLLSVDCWLLLVVCNALIVDVCVCRLLFVVWCCGVCCLFLLSVCCLLCGV